MREKLLLSGLIILLSCTLFSQKVDVNQLKGMNIRNIGPAGMSGRVTAIDVDLSNPQIIYVGTASGGVWRSESGGIRWEPVFEDAPIQSIGAVKINQKNPSEIWVGTGEGNPRNSHNSGEGIFKSIDSGKTWTRMGLEKTRLIHRIIIHRDQPDIVYVGALGSSWGANEERGVFKTTDGGKTWKKILYVNDQTGVADMVVDPTNPNKILVAMWEFGRKPWVFNSGGKGSGLYLTFDGGENWKRISEKEGLPKGELGRIGLAIAPSKPNIIYALVEAKKNALYGSKDGGHTWKMIAEKNIGNRPFYYSEIYVDPLNENRIWNLYSYVSKSEDGGKTFETILDYGKGVHPDHHAFWIHPEDPNFMINGNDGGLNISRDRGANWEFVDNIPAGQFYHINYDMDFPYHVMGGMQDNGSWVGPGFVLKSGGIRNEDWQEVLFGDGFDILLRRDNNRFGLGMSQGGSLSYFDRETGKTRSAKPYHPEGKDLRFNWNAALAQNPFHDCGIYFGSQYVHKSMDCGKSYEIISPDLTTNDTIKQKESQNTGGLTKDVTQAENFTTIIAISPSPVDEEVIWVGTDDGNLQLTRDGGKKWTNLSSRLPDFNPGSWIPQIEVSLKNAGEAFVVVNDYRRNDYRPFVYHTTDFGNSWRRIVNENKVEGYALCIVQDPVEPNLLFLGTDYGLYFSIDSGQIWNKWTKGFPSVQTADLKIHPREHDLIIGTFGRAIWILDDIRPLREIAKTKGKVLEQKLKVFDTPDAYLVDYRSVDGVRFTADGTFLGQNKRGGAMVSVWVKPDSTKAPSDKATDSAKAASDKKSRASKRKSRKKSDLAKAASEKESEATEAPSDIDEGSSEESDSIKVETELDPASTKASAGKKGMDGKKLGVTVYDAAGDTIRNYTQNADTTLFRIYWGMNSNGVSFPSYRDRKPTDNPPGGPSVLPGRYKIVIEHKGEKDSTYVNVKKDPRSAITDADLRAELEATKEFYKIVEKATIAFDRLKEAKKTIKLVNDQMINAPDTLKKDIAKQGKAMQDSIAALMQIFTDPPNQKGIQRTPNTLNSRLFQASGYIRSSDGPPSQMARFATARAIKEVEEALQAVNNFFLKDWVEYQKKAEAAKHSLFKPYEPIRLE